MVKRAVALEIIFTSLYLESVLRNATFGELCEACSLYVLRNNVRGNGDSSVYRMTYLVTAVSVAGEECESVGKNAWFLSPSICLHFHINSTQGTWERQRGDSPESHSDAGSGGEGSQDCGRRSTGMWPPLKQTGEQELWPCEKAMHLYSRLLKCDAVNIQSRYIFGLSLCWGCVGGWGWGKRCCPAPYALSSICSLPSGCL